MSGRRTHAAAESSDRGAGGSKLCHGVRQEERPWKQAGDAPAAAAAMRGDLQSPQRRFSSRYPGLSTVDSPSDVEPSQDIFWDSTSPTNPNTGLGLRNTKFVEISDIVNRIAPKDVKPRGTESPLLQWLGDSPVSCTPEVLKPRPRRRSSRQSSVEDLKKLARQFDENMQQDKETLEHLNAANTSKEGAAISRTEPAEASPSSNAMKCLSSVEQAEAELQAIFDCSTQKISGRLSQDSSRSSSSQPTAADRSTPAAEVKVTAASCDDFDDDWDNDELIHDTFEQVMTQNPERPEMNANLKRSTAPSGQRSTPPAVSTPTTSFRPVLKSKGGTLQDLCPKTKTTNRSTFRLGPDPRLRPTGAAQDAANPKPHVSQLKSAPTPPPPPVATGSAQNAADSLWGDDALFFEVCDPVERISNSQPAQHRPASAKTTAPLPIDNGRPAADRQSPRAFVRSNSLPERCGGYRGWSVPMRGADGRPQMSQSLPGSRAGGGGSASFGTFQAAGAKPHTVAAKTQQEAKPHHGAAKRNVPQPVGISSKVFVTGPKAAKCSAAEIERKKQEALARRRQRMQSAQKPQPGRVLTGGT